MLLGLAVGVIALQQVNDTRDGQWPFAAIWSCIDSRTSAELIFEQGLGDVFSVHIAGNFLNDDILGSLEFACHAAGTKFVVVVGHSKCGAIQGACDGVELGHLTGLLEKIKPAVVSADVVVSPGDAIGAALIEERRRPFARLTTVLGSAIDYGPVAHYFGMLSAALGRYDEAIAHFDEALRAEQKAGAIVFSLRTRIGRARAYHLRDGAGDRARAMQGLREALGASEARPHALVAREARDLAVLLGMGDGRGSATARTQRRTRSAPAALD